MDKNGVLKSIDGSALPAAVKEYFAGVVRCDSSSALKTGLKKNPALLTKNINLQLDEAADILGRPAEDVLFITGFNVNDAAPERFEAALAEIRALIALSDEGFSGLRLMDRCAGRTADITGIKNGKKYVLEVCCVSSGTALTAVDYVEGALAPGGGRNPADLLMDKYGKKKLQLNSARKKTNSDFSCLICVVNPVNFARFVDRDALAALAAEWYDRTGKPSFTHFFLLSGSYFSVFPPWHTA